jgi:hypothetical protein
VGTVASAAALSAVMIGAGPALAKPTPAPVPSPALGAVTGALHNPLVKVPGAVGALKHGLGSIGTVVKHPLPLPSTLPVISGIHPVAIPGKLPKARRGGLPIPLPSGAVSGLTGGVSGALNGATGALTGATSGPLGGLISAVQSLLGLNPKA